MKETKLNDILEFMKQWDNQDKTDDEGYKPFNEYAIGALLVGRGFVLKWYLTRANFDSIIKELNEIEGCKTRKGATKKRLTLGQYQIELEVDKHGVLELEQGYAKITAMFDEIQDTLDFLKKM